MNKRLGCLSRSGIVAALLTFLLVAGVGFLLGGRLFSPGPLNAQAGEAPLGGVLSHAEIGGRCAACHVAPWSQETMADRCIVCHTEIGLQLQEPSSLHGALTLGESAVQCRACHPEHGGPDAPLTVIDPARFPHEATGYALQGHRQKKEGTLFVCADCHGREFARFDPLTCLNCHFELDAAYMQAHERAFGRGCLACHDGVDTYGAAFDHNQQDFPLQGKHAGLACADCHLGARAVADLQATLQDCFSCHQADDAHEGRFGQDCARCHTPDDWQQATFDHSLAAFKLTGAHVQVDCVQCHVNDVFQGTPQDCFSCHQADDAHEGRFGQNCAQCHTPDDWQQATFDHSLAAFKLTGAHVGVDCVRCHVNDVFRGTPQDCFSCHGEPGFHAGLLGTDCAACHTTTAWLPAQYNRPHTFPIDHGGSGWSPCRTCHPTSLGSYTCYNCHEHNPAGIESKHREEGIFDFQNCVSCHPTGREEENGGGGDDD